VKGVGEGSHTYFWNFGTPSISRKPFELETSNFACRLTTRGANEQNAKLGKRLSGRGHVTYLLNFGTPCIFLERSLFLAQDWNQCNSGLFLAKVGCHGNYLFSLEILDSLFEFADPENITIHAKNCSISCTIKIFTIFFVYKRSRVSPRFRLT